MQSVFSHIASFQYYHEYHGGKSGGVFQLKIPTETQKSLLNLNLVIKPFDSGFHLLSGDTSLLQNELKPLRFHFQVKDSLFWNYTELEGFYPQKNLIFHSNLLITEENETGTKGRLIDQDALYTNHHVKKFPFDLINSQNPIVLDEMGNSKDVDPNGPLGNDVEDETTFTMPSETAEKRLYIFPNPLFMLPDMVFALKPAKFFEDLQSNSPVTYQINFKARATKWRYIISDPDLKTRPMHVIQNAKKVIYSFTEKQININGLGMMRCFESAQEILFQNPASVDFQLIGTEPDPKKSPPILLRYLPVASPENIHQDNSSKGNIYSHIFI